MKNILLTLTHLVFFSIFLFPQLAISERSNNYNVNRVEELQSKLRENTKNLQRSLNIYDKLQNQYNEEKLTLGSVNGKYYDPQVMRQIIIIEYLEKNQRFTMNDVENKVKASKLMTKYREKRVKKILQEAQTDIMMLRATGEKHQRELSKLLAQMSQGSRNVPLEDWTFEMYEKELEMQDSVRNMEYNECVPKRYSDRCTRYVKVWFNKSDGRHSYCRNPAKHIPSIRCEIECLCADSFKNKKGGVPKFYPLK